MNSWNFCRDTRAENVQCRPLPWLKTSAGFLRYRQVMTEGHRDALRQRMTAFTEEELAKLQEAQDEEGDSPSSLSNVLPKAPTQYQVTSLAVSDEGVLGTTLAGTEIFQIPKSRMPETLTAATLIELAADTLGIAQTSLTLWEGKGALVLYVKTDHSSIRRDMPI